jgi:hypothetical protein
MMTAAVLRNKLVLRHRGLFHLQTMFPYWEAAKLDWLTVKFATEFAPQDLEQIGARRIKELSESQIYRAEVAKHRFESLADVCTAIEVIPVRRTSLKPA